MCTFVCIASIWGFNMFYRPDGIFLYLISLIFFWIFFTSAVFLARTLFIFEHVFRPCSSVPFYSYFSIFIREFYCTLHKLLVWSTFVWRIIILYVLKYCVRVCILSSSRGYTTFGVPGGPWPVSLFLCILLILVEVPRTHNNTHTTNTRKREIGQLWIVNITPTNPLLLLNMKKKKVFWNYKLVFVFTVPSVRVTIFLYVLSFFYITTVFPNARDP